VNKAAGWAEKVGKGIKGGTAIGKNYSTLILDMGYQTSDIYINTDDETIELYGEEVNSFPEFKKVYDKHNKENVDENAKGWDSSKDTPEIKALMAIADDTSKSYTERDEARQKAYDLRAAMSTQEEGLSKGYWAKKIPGGMNEDLLGDMISDMLKYKTKEEVLAYLKQIMLSSDENNKALDESSSKIKNILSKIGDIEEKIYNQYGDDEIDAKFDYASALDDIKKKYKNDEIKMYDALVSHLNKLKSSFPLKESYTPGDIYQASNGYKYEILPLPDKFKGKFGAGNLNIWVKDMQDGKEHFMPQSHLRDYKKIPGGKMEESYATLVNKLKKQGKSEKASKAIAGAVAAYKAKGGGSGPTAKQAK
jgi:hypothetical protein